MTVLVVMTEPGAGAFAQCLTDLGIDAVPCPVTIIKPVVKDIQWPADLQAVAFSSAHAVRIYSRLNGPRQIPAFTVGSATAAEARAAGFHTVHDAASDVNGLAKTVAQECLPEAGSIGYPAALDVAGDLAGALRRKGYTVIQRPIYQAAAVERLTESAELALRTRTTTGAAFFSTRNAAIFCSLMVSAGHQDFISGMQAWCLSDAIASALRGGAKRLQWKRIIVADASKADAMARAIQQTAGRVNQYPD
ncbi:MAG: uroporphyrinogen-III synthase [Rhodospirillaceae bacterium]|nr:uroporphyrinogen-III synthase [Rhodospirillaceae bacterium]